MDAYQIFLIGALSAGVLLFASLLTVRILDDRLDRDISVGLTRLLERAKRNDLDVSRGLAENLSKIGFPLSKYTDSVPYHSMLEDVVKMIKAARGMENQVRDVSREG